jgi:hypothetical protein
VREAITALASSWRDALTGLDTVALPDTDVRWLVEQLAGIEKLTAAARVRLAAVLQTRGDRQTAEWLGRTTGSSTAKARSELEARREIDECPATAAAVDTGRLSMAQGAEIAKAQPASASEEADLVAFAANHTMAGLREEVRRRRLAAIDAEELHRAQHAAMELRHWTNDIGNTVLHAELAPEIGTPIVTRLKRATDRVFRAAYKAGRRDSNEKYAAEAFVQMLNDTSAGTSKQKADVVFAVDLNAYRRGHAEPGEVCRIVGGSPVPVDVVKTMAQDGFLKAVIHDGVNIHLVKHFGRHIPATLRTALDLGPPPGFDGLQCDDDDCDKRDGIEIDHLDPVANGGPTSTKNIGPKCKPSHRAKTERDRAQGLLGTKRRRGPP